VNQPLFHWIEPAAARRFRSGVSLHSHTSLSRETLMFVPRHTEHVPLLCGAVKKLEDRFRETNGYDLDYREVWWTPPLSPREAFALERGQIESVLGIPGMVSLTDHDDLAAGVVASALGAPVSLEWTLPHGPVFFHIGLHNIDPSLMPLLRRTTADPQPAKVIEVLSSIHASGTSLIVLNHPLWDEIRAGDRVHRESFRQLMERYRPWIHALELNGLRSWRENREVCEIADSLGLPVVSGGDRHGIEPNANVNLTNAATFDEFAGEIRQGRSTVLFLSQYRKNIHARTVRLMCDVLRDLPESRWNDRIFYRSRPLSEWLGDSKPGVIAPFLAFIRAAEVFL
jgi:hypothetical protein